MRTQQVHRIGYWATLKKFNGSFEKTEARNSASNVTGELQELDHVRSQKALKKVLTLSLQQ